MAVSIDKVYQKVLALANKKQRGYITPQEFNLFADHAQMDIFEQYFYDVEQFGRRPNNQTDLYDITNLTKHKLDAFKRTSSIQTNDDLTSIPDFYRLGEVYFERSNWSGITNIEDPLRGFTVVEELDQNEFIASQAGPLTRATSKRPIYWIADNKIKFIPRPASSSGRYLARYIVKPQKPNWTYLISGSKNALYNPSATDHQDFELHSSEENNLVLKILQLAGIAIKDLQLTGVAGQEEAKGIQQEKQ